jgi:hypothetical protein
MDIFERVPTIGIYAEFVVHDDMNDVIGSYAEIRVPGAWNTVYVGFKHDWDGHVTEEYNPLCLGVFDDPDTIVRLIEEAAREATS